jgi:hypothetical protein
MLTLARKGREWEGCEKERDVKLKGLTECGKR